MVTAANTVAVLCFMVARIVRWPEALLVGVGALAGGVGGANLGKRLPAAWVRRATVLYACAITALFFVRAYG